MFITFHVNVIVYQIFNLPHIYHIFFKTLFYVKILKFFMWFTNTIQTMRNQIVKYIFNFHKKIKIISNFLK
jgi:1-acyl-sn-glycerol-3-phosphate acyltransferase